MSLHLDILIYKMYFYQRHLQLSVYRFVRKFMAEGSNCPFKVFFEGKWPLNTGNNCERLHPVKGTSTRVISFGFHLGQSLTNPFLQWITWLVTRYGECLMRGENQTLRKPDTILYTVKTCQLPSPRRASLPDQKMVETL